MSPLAIDDEVIIAAAPQVVFDALTQPAQIVRCFPLETAQVDPRPGGEIRLTGTADGRGFTDLGTVDVYDPPHVFQYTYWSDNHGTSRRPENHMTIRYRLEAVAGGTRVAVTHRNLLTTERRDQMREVWAFLLGQLARFAQAPTSSSDPNG